MRMHACMFSIDGLFRLQLFRPRPDVYGPPSSRTFNHRHQHVSISFASEDRLCNLPCCQPSPSLLFASEQALSSVCALLSAHFGTVNGGGDPQLCLSIVSALNEVVLISVSLFVVLDEARRSLSGDAAATGADAQHANATNRSSCQSISYDNGAVATVDAQFWFISRQVNARYITRRLASLFGR